MVVHPRTLEFYRQMEFADDVIARGIKIESAGLREARSSGSVEVRCLQFRSSRMNCCGYGALAK
jgi:hypothetical protein